MTSVLSQALEISGKGVISLVGAGGKTTLMGNLARELAGQGEPVLITTTTKIRRPASMDADSIIISPDPMEVVKKVRDSDGKRGLVVAAAADRIPGDKLSGYPLEDIDAIAASGIFKWIIVEADGAAQRALKAPADHEPVIPRASHWVVGVIGLDAAGKSLDEENVFRAGLFSGLTGLPVGGIISPGSLAQILAHPDGIFKGSPAGADLVVFLNKADTSQRLKAAREVIETLNDAKNISISRIVIGKLLPAPVIIEYHDIHIGRGS